VKTVRKGREKSFRTALHTAHIGSSDLSGVNNVEGGRGDVVSNRIQSEDGLDKLADFDVRGLNRERLTQDA